MREFFVEWYAAWVRALLFPLVRQFEQEPVTLESCGCLACPPGICDLDCPWCNEDGVPLVDDLVPPGAAINIPRLAPLTTDDLVRGIEAAPGSGACPRCGHPDCRPATFEPEDYPLVFEPPKMINIGRTFD